MQLQSRLSSLFSFIGFFSPCGKSSAQRLANVYAPSRSTYTFLILTDRCAFYLRDHFRTGHKVQFDHVTAGIFFHTFTVRSVTRLTSRACFYSSFQLVRSLWLWEVFLWEIDIFSMLCSAFVCIKKI